MKILILYASFGGGHLKAAEALKEYYIDTYPNYEVMFLDALKYTSPDLNKIYLKSYVELAKTLPKAWEKIYKFSDQYNGLPDFASILNIAVSKKFNSLVTEFNPNIIICTHPFALDMLSVLKKKATIKSKIGLVITDYALHAFWITQPQTVDAFFVTHDLVAESLIKEGIDKNKIYITGIPVLKAIYQDYNKKELLKEFNLNNKFTVLFLPGGEYGLSKNNNIFKDLLRIQNIQIIAITGRNEKLKNKFEKLGSLSSKNVKVMGYTNEIPKLLAVSDLVLSKTGGLTTTETIVSHTPIVITSPLPGQEEHNSNYILNNGLGFRLFNGCNVLFTLKSIIDNKFRLNQIIEMQKRLSKPNAAKDICETMNKLY